MNNKFVLMMMVMLSSLFAKSYVTNHYYDENTYSSATEIKFKDTKDVSKIVYVYAYEILTVYMKNGDRAVYKNIRRSEFNSFKKSPYPDNYYTQFIYGHKR